MLRAVLLWLLLPAFLMADEYDTLRLKWRDIIVGAGYDTADSHVVARLSSIASAANTQWSSLDTSPTRTFLWSDLASTTVSSHVTSNYARLRAMALAYATPGCALAGNAALLADLLSGLDWMHANRYHATSSQYDNWWDWEIGTPLQLTDIAVLIYDQISPAQLGLWMAAIEHQVPTPDMTHANKVWKARAVGVRGCLVKSAAKLVLCRDAFSAVFPYVTSGDGYYTDGSFIQHDYHPYTAGYGAALIANMAPVMNWLSGSTWAVTDPAQANLYRWVFDSYEPILYRGNTFDLVRGREAGRSNSSPNGHAMLDSILQVAQFAPPAEAARMKSLVKEWALSDTARDFVSGRGLPTLTMAKQLMSDPSVIPRGELLAHYHFAEMDRVIHLGQGYGFGLTMHSSRIANFESINGENLRGWFTGDGQTTLYNADLNAFADSYWATVDHHRLPGVTVDVTHNKLPHQSASIGPRAQGQNTRSTFNWVGGAALGRYGAAGMQFKGVGVTLTGKKSWFMFDDEIVCLGAGITSTDARPIETTVENRKLSVAGSNAFTVNGVAKPSALGWTESLTGVQWAHLAGHVSGSDIGYFFPQSPTLKAVREARTGAWSDIDSDGATTAITRSYLRLGFEHGSSPSNASYQYVLLPGRNATRTGYYAEAPQVSVLANTASIQAVEETTLGLTAANFWNDGTQSVGMITVNKKCSVLVRQDPPFLDVAVSDPTQANASSIDLQIALPGGTLVSADAGISVTQTSPAIVMSVQVAGNAGQSYHARFYLGTPQVLSLDATADAYVYDGAPTTNQGGSNPLVVKKSAAGFNRESYLRFNVPSGAGVVLGATLKLRCLGATLPGLQAVAKVDDSSWLETGAGGITWNTKPVSHNVPLSTWTPIANEPTNVPLGTAVTTAGPLSLRVYGSTQTADGYTTYGSRENTTPAHRPQLELSLGHTPPEVSLTRPLDGEQITREGLQILTAEALATDGAITQVAFYEGALLLGTDSESPYQIEASLAGGSHWLRAVATDANGLQRTSLIHRITVAHAPVAQTAHLSTARGVSLEVDLRQWVSDVETPLTQLRFALGVVEHGSVVLLADGHTARFSPEPGYSGPARFEYQVIDTTRDDRTLLNYAFAGADLTDSSGLGRDGSLNVQGTGSASYATDLPAALSLSGGQSLVLTENGTAGAARLERSLLTSEVDWKSADWTISGWFKRKTATNQDSLVQLGDSGGYASNALTLAFYGAGSTLELRNYHGSTQDVALVKTNVTTGQWHHVAIVRSGTSLSWYLNGVLVGTDTEFNFGFSNTQPVKWGGVTPTVLDRWWNGSLADLAVFDDDLSGPDITRLVTLPVAWWGGQRHDATVHVEVLHPPVALSGSKTAARDAIVDIDLTSLVTDADSPLADLRFSVSSSTQGSVSLLADGRTARFTPQAGYTGSAGFSFSVLDRTPDPRLWLNWPLRGALAEDESSALRHGALNLQGNGSVGTVASAPASLAPQSLSSLSLMENGSAGAARLERSLSALSPLTSDWTIAGWFLRQSTANIDSLVQLGESGGWASHALSLVLPLSSNSMELRNYNADVQDVAIVKTGITAGVWHHFAIVRQGTTLHLYVNGTLAGSDSDFTFSFDAAKPLKLGGVGNPASSSLWERWFKGQLSDVAVFEQALNGAEVAHLQLHPVSHLSGQRATGTVSLNLVQPIESWRWNHFGSLANTGLSADDADGDHDGVANLLEYATGSLPGSADQAPSSVTRGGSVVEFRYRRNKAAMDLSYIVEWSDDLSAAGWSTAGVSAAVVVPGSDLGDTELRQVQVPAGSGVMRRFVRLRVVRN